MGKADAISVHLTDDLVAAANSAIANGEFASLDHVLHAAMDEWRGRRERDLGRLRTLSEQGLASGFEDHDGMDGLKRAARVEQATRRG